MWADHGGGLCIGFPPGFLSLCYVRHPGSVRFTRYCRLCICVLFISSAVWKTGYSSCALHKKLIKKTSFQTKVIPSRWYCSDHNANSRDRPRSSEGAFVINTDFNQQTGDVRVDPGLLIGGAQLWRWAAGRSE